MLQMGSYVFEFSPDVRSEKPRTEWFLEKFLGIDTTINGFYLADLEGEIIINLNLLRIYMEWRLGEILLLDKDCGVGKGKVTLPEN